jgi:hypothetical protein
MRHSRSGALSSSPALAKCASHPVVRFAPRYFGLVFVASVLSACSRAPAELDVTPSSSSSPPPTVAPLTWEVPGAWPSTGVPKGGQKRAEYKVPKAGNDKDDAELTVAFFGTGSEGDDARRFKEAFALFDGDVGASAQREDFDVNALKVSLADVVGTYKISLTPPVGAQKRSPVQMVKPSYRMLIAVVKTPDRGNWFFKLVGPDETVQAARSGFRSVLQSVK